MSDEVIKTYCTIETCFAFKLPARTGAGQYSAKTWGDHNWEGSLKMLAKGDKGMITLQNANGFFAKSPVDIDTKLEGVVDSSRYFVLKVISANGSKAYIGIGFGDRSHAFDLKSGIQRFQSILKAEQDAKNGGIQVEEKDYSLHSGEQIKINLSKDKLKKAGKKKKHNHKKKSEKKKSGEVPQDWVTF